MLKRNLFVLLMGSILLSPLTAFAESNDHVAASAHEPTEKKKPASVEEHVVSKKPVDEHAHSKAPAGEEHDKPHAKSVSAEATAEATKPHEAAASHEKPSAVETPKILPADVRVLIDVSGSMKQTDPQNLRKPALDLIVRLLPDKSRAGIWTFGNAVNMLMPFKPVDSTWRTQAATKATAINSVAMFTNIGKALDEVSFDKKSLSPDYKTHIMLLTDGVVDIGPDAVANNKERQRIISEVLPSLKAAGYVVHTIALSANADSDLLKRLSVATDGLSTTAISAEQLMSVFLKIFDQAVPAERVPLENNGFLVDASIKEFTALIFRKPGEDKTVIASPQGKEYSATNPTDGVNWYRTDKYDLITVDEPKPGQWKIKSDIAPQSRVTVVSNLQFIVTPLKNNIQRGDPLAINYSFQENGKTVTNKDFLGLIDVTSISAKMHSEENIESTFDVKKIPEDGLYHQSLENFNEAGDYEVHLYVDGKTFKRELKHSLSVRDGFMVVSKEAEQAQADKANYSYKISTDEKLVSLKKTKVNYSVSQDGKEVLSKELKLTEDNHWEFSFAPEHEGEYSIDVHSVGELQDGTAFDEVVHADKFTYAPAMHEEEKSVETHEPTKKEEHVTAHEEKALEPSEKPAENKSSLVLYSGIALGNLLLIGLLVFLYKKFIGGKEKNEMDEIEKVLAAKPKKNEGVESAKKLESKPVEEKLPDKAEIDLLEEDASQLDMADEDMDKLFPLDSMDDPNGKDDDNL